MTSIVDIGKQIKNTETQANTPNWISLNLHTNKLSRSIYNAIKANI